MLFNFEKERKSVFFLYLQYVVLRCPWFALSYVESPENGFILYRKCYRLAEELYQTQTQIICNPIINYSNVLYPLQRTNM